MPELRARLEALLPAALVPSAFVTLDVLPLTTSGKVDRRTLPAPERDREAAGEAYVAPRNPVEAMVAGVWAEVLGVDRVGVHDDFFALGGHSLTALRVISKLRAHGVDVQPRHLFERRTIARLAASVEERPRCMVLLRTGGSRTPTLFFPGAGGVTIGYSALVRALHRDLPFWGFDAPLIAGAGEMPATLEELVDRYIDEVLDHGDARAFNLVGHSFGGLVSLSMASRLSARGCHVEQIVLLDTLPPIPLPLGDAALDDRGAVPLLDGRSEVEILRRVADVARTFLRWMPSWRPSPVPAGRITLFRAREESAVERGRVRPSRDHDYGWSRILERPVDVIDAPGAHDTMLTDGNGAVVGSRLNELLLEDDAQRR